MESKDKRMDVGNLTIFLRRVSENSRPRLEDLDDIAFKYKFLPQSPWVLI